ncbi:MAG: hypothetical protein R3F61_03740 [Myxococcota bacterium]
MRFLWLGASLVALGACRAAVDAGDTDTIPTQAIDTDTPDLPAPALSAFRGNTWLVEDLSIVDDTDVDGDGALDNKLPDVLHAVDLLMRDQDMSTEQINRNIAANIAQLVTIVFIDARSDGDTIELDVLAGMEGSQTELLVDPASYDASGDAVSQLSGAFVEPLAFAATGDVLLRVTMAAGLEPSPVQLHDVRLEGEITASELVLTAVLRGVIPIDRFIDDAVAPLVPEEGFEIVPGTVSTKEEVLDLIREIAPALSDVTLPSGEAGISAVFEVSAGEWEITR